MLFHQRNLSRNAFLPWLAILCLLLASAGAGAQSSTAPVQEHRISPEEAEELLRSVDDVLQFGSERTGMPIREEVKRELAGREQVQQYIYTRIHEDEDAERLRSAATVLKKFGLVPRDFDLEALLIELMGDQVAGYYDTKTRTVYLLNWLPPETQQPVLAHELVHALQDQNFGLEKWIRQVDVRNQGADMQIASDEALAARHAVIEGQAMAVMIDFLLAPVGGSLVKSPLVAEAMQRGMLESADSPVLARTPLYVKQLLMFPYRHGLNFIRELLVAHGQESAYADIFQNPPQHTRHLMQPETYLAGEKLPVLAVPNIDALLGSGYGPFDVGSIGQFDVSVIIQQFAPATSESKIVAREEDHEPITSPDEEPGSVPPLWNDWRGGYYYAARKQARAAGGATASSAEVPTASEVPADEIALAYVSQWASPQAAADFAEIYRASIPSRYARSSAIPASACGDCVSDSKNATFHDTDEGRVSVEVHGALVVALESFEPSVAGRIRSAVLEAAE